MTTLALLRFSAMLPLTLAMVACGQSPQSPINNKPTSNHTVTAQSLPDCGSVSGYYTVITYFATSSKMCRLDTPGPYDTDPYTAGNQAPLWDPAHAYVILVNIRGSSVFHGYTNNTFGDNPLFNEKTVAQWHFPGEDNLVTINGAFFDCAEKCVTNTSHLSWPFKDQDALQTIGNNLASDDGVPKRALCWNNGTMASVNAWSLGSSNSTSASVSQSSQYCRNMLVGMSPAWMPQNQKTPLTFVGIKTTNFTNDTLCFYVGGYQTRAKASADLNAFGCTPAVQLDGGNSSQMSFVTTNGRVDAVQSWEKPQLVNFTRTDRLVPHVLRIFR